jgi:cellulose synthase/poly-beta-1,6-N-acetylglucosamine synthase-like glycosyltransferase
MLELVFWIAAGLLVYTHVGYPLLLGLLARRERPQPPLAELPSVSLIVAAHDEAAVIERRVSNAFALDYPRDRFELIVSSDGSTDATVERAQAAGADLVLDLPRGGKIRAQDAAVERSSGVVVAFSDANAYWAPDALRALVEPFADPRVGYVCGQVRFVDDAGTNMEGLYWRYEMWIRSRESRLAGVTGGNGAIYAVRKKDYLVVDPRMGHDLSFPFNMVKRGRRPVYEPRALATEKMVPTIEGEFARKRRMMGHGWLIVLRGGLLSPRGYSPLYALEIFSHRVLRYLSPFLHVVALGANVALVADGPLYAVTLAIQVALLVCALAGVRIARYYVLMTASLAAGLWDWLRRGTPAEWEKAEGTR